MEADELKEFMAKLKADAEAGGLPAILNNLKGLGTALGGNAALAGVLTAVGVAAYIAVPLVAAYLDKEIQGRPPLPPEAE